jgi:predicted DNA-binding protein
MKIFRISESQIEQGIKIEKEHKDVYDALCKKFGDDMPWTLEEFAKKIAEAHLEELDDYYSRLKQMEQEAEKEI